MKRGRRFLTALVVVMFAHLGSAAAGQLPELSVSQPSEAVVEPDNGSSSATTELVVLGADSAVPVRVTFKGAADTPVKVKSVEPLAVEGPATTLVVTLTGLNGLDDSASGALVVQGGAAPVAVATKVEPPLDSTHDWMAAIVIAALVAMVVLMVVVFVAAALTGKVARLTERAPGPKWSFSSWATTLTAVGGVLGTILASITFPEHPKQIDKDSLVGLSLLFAGLVVVAPFVFQSMRNPKVSPTDQEGGLWGYNWALLLACSITCGAVLGEMASLALLSQELISDDFWAGAALVAVALLVLLALYYFFVTAYQLATSKWPVPKATVKTEDGKQSIVIGTAAARADAEEEEPGQVEISVAPVRGGWSLP